MALAGLREKMRYSEAPEGLESTGDASFCTLWSFCGVPAISLPLLEGPNGLPVVVIECKSPKVKDAIPEAIDQLLRYSEQRGAKGEGSQPLFFYNQF